MEKEIKGGEKNEQLEKQIEYVVKKIKRFELEKLKG